jgi:hypothetical protein
LTGQKYQQFFDIYKSILSDLESQHSRTPAISKLFMAFIWLRHYPSERMLSIIVECSESSVSRILSSVIDIMFKFMENSISFLNRKGRDLHSVQFANKQFSLVIDRTYQELPKPISLDEKFYYSGHRGMHCLNRLLGCTPDGLICWISKPYGGSIIDKQLMGYQESLNLFSQLGEDEYIMADAGFTGLEKLHPSIIPFTKNTGEELSEYEKTFNNRLNSHRIVVENVFAQIKKYLSCSLKWRHSINQNEKVWMIVSALVSKKLRY